MIGKTVNIDILGFNTTTRQFSIKMRDYGTTGKRTRLHSFDAPIVVVEALLREECKKAELWVGRSVETIV